MNAGGPGPGLELQPAAFVACRPWPGYDASAGAGTGAGVSARRPIVRNDAPASMHRAPAIQNARR